jgi:ABC-2 type transport system permease protein
MGLEARLMGWLLPATFFMDMVRGVYLKGLGPGDFLPQLAALAGYFALYLGLAIRRVRKRLD